MLAELRFVQGAVAKKDLLPAMTHFAIEGGTVRSFNGSLALCSPIPFDIDCKPKAGPLVQAISNCTETVTLSMTAAGKLKIQSGKFKAFVECVHEETPHVLPEGEEILFDGDILLKALKVLMQFSGNDASRPWTNGILLRDQSAFATNNVVLAEYWLGSRFPITVNVPRVAVKEMLRIGEPPISAQLTDNSITFHYPNGRWIRTQLLSNEWPDLGKVLDRAANVTPINSAIFDGIRTIKPFADKLGRIFFTEGAIATHPDTGEGAVFEIEGWDVPGVYHADMLLLLEGVAQQADLTNYPDPCLFYGDRIRGAIIGMKL